MRSRRSANEQLAEVARRRLELLSAELAEIRSDPVDAPIPDGPDGSGEPLVPDGSPAVRDPGPGRHAQRSVGVAASVGGWTHDRLPATLQGRVRVTAAHVAVLALLVAAALGVATWWAVRAAGAGTTLPPVSSPPSALAAVPSASAPPTSSPGTAAAGASPSGDIVVDVAGKVRRPGIATLPLGARVVDALRAAGGARPGVRLGSLNLARVLVDGEQILVGVATAPGLAASAAAAPTADSTTPMVNINSASQAQLEELPGVGPVTAQSILTFRTENGAFSAVDELLEVSGIGEATLAKIAPFVTL
jgi:competence protein ComEA